MSGLFQEKAITPDESLSLAGTDWLIGNHSDELTPWIPVMAARQVISSSIQPLLESQLMSSEGVKLTGRVRERESRHWVTSVVGLLGAVFGPTESKLLGLIVLSNVREGREVLDGAP